MGKNSKKKILKNFNSEIFISMFRLLLKIYNVIIKSVKNAKKWIFLSIIKSKQYQKEIFVSRWKCLSDMYTRI